MGTSWIPSDTPIPVILRLIEKAFNSGAAIELAFLKAGDTH